MYDMFGNIKGPCTMFIYCEWLPCKPVNNIYKRMCKYTIPNSTYEYVLRAKGSMVSCTYSNIPQNRTGFSRQIWPGKYDLENHSHFSKVKQNT